jgi:1-acyl-sn-glycerol-3-phosphate acyltransferase
MPFFSPVWWRSPAKEELFDFPIVRNIISSWGAFPVRRGKRDLKAIQKMIELLQSSVVLIAPEGTRSTTGELLKGKSGVGKIIYDGRPQKVIPVRVRGVDQVLPKGSIFPRIGKKTTIHFGAPMDMTAFYAMPESIETSRKIVDAVMEALGKL